MAKILVVDDNRVDRLTTRRVLEENDYLVYEAQNGLMATKLIQTTPIDLVITDIVMPEMDGIETIRNTASMKPGLPIITLVSAKYSSYTEVAIKLGAVYGLCKPLNDEELLAAIQKALAKA